MGDDFIHMCVTLMGIVRRTPTLDNTHSFIENVDFDAFEIFELLFAFEIVSE